MILQKISDIGGLSLFVIYAWAIFFSPFYSIVSNLQVRSPMYIVHTEPTCTQGMKNYSKLLVSSVIHATFISPPLSTLDID
jgi:hypothetical protein